MAFPYSHDPSEGIDSPPAEFEQCALCGKRSMHEVCGNCLDRIQPDMRGRLITDKTDPRAVPRVPRQQRSRPLSRKAEYEEA